MIQLIDDPKLSKGKQWAETWINDNLNSELMVIRNAVIYMTPGVVARVEDLTNESTADK